MAYASDTCRVTTKLQALTIGMTAAHMGKLVLSPSPNLPPPSHPHEKEGSTIEASDSTARSSPEVNVALAGEP